LMYPLSNNELIKEDKRILTKISIWVEKSND
jgi:hypothetical protein